MGTKQFDNYADLITFTRASGGTALRPISYGPELVTNGTFDTDTGWTKGTGWSISGGLAVHTGATAGYLTQSNVTEVGKVYKVTLDITALASGKSVQIWDTSGGNVLLSFDSTGSVSGSFLATDTTLYIRESASAECTIDNISVKEVLFDQPNAPLTLFNHPTNIPRIEYDADGNRLGLLVEEQRTNLVTYSEDFSNAAWIKSNASIDSNVIVAPDGTLTGDKLVSTAVNNSHYIRQVISSGNNTASVFAKQGEFTHLKFTTNAHAFAASYFDLSAGTVASENANHTATITSFGNGWYRCSITPVDAFDGVYIENAGNGVNSTHLGDGTSGIYIWGAQVEAGAFSTSYIPTSGSTATRAEDVASIPTSAFGYNASEGTVVVEAEMTNSVTSGQRYVIGSNSMNSRWVYKNDTKDNLTSYDGDSVLENTLSNLSDGVFFKVASSTDQSERALAVDGNIATKSTTGGIASLTASIRIGCANTNDKQLNGHIKSIKYYPRRLSDAQLQELTQ